MSLAPLSLVQYWYFFAAGGLITPAIWPEPAMMKRTGPLNSWVDLNTELAGAM